VHVSKLVPLLAGSWLLVAWTGSAAEPVRIGLLPVVVHSSEADTGYLSSGLAEMLSARLEQFPQLSVIRLDRSAEPTMEESAAVEEGRAVGAEYVVFGAFTQFGAGASFDVRCARVGGPDDGDSSRRVFIQSGTTAEIIPRLEELATKIHRHVAGVDAARAAAGNAAGQDAGEARDDRVEELLRRVDALERAVYAPATTASPADEAEVPGGAEPDSNGSPVR
jgi:hypothetical protein